LKESQEFFRQKYAYITIFKTIKVLLKNEKINRENQPSYVQKKYLERCFNIYQPKCRCSDIIMKHKYFIRITMGRTLREDIHYGCGLLTEKVCFQSFGRVVSHSKEIPLHNIYIYKYTVYDVQTFRQQNCIPTILFSFFFT